MPLEKEAVLSVHHSCTQGHSCCPFLPRNLLFGGCPLLLLVLSDYHQFVHYRMLSLWRSNRPSCFVLQSVAKREFSYYFTFFGFFAVLADSINALAVGAPLLPTLRIFSPEPSAIRLRFAQIFAYSPCLATLVALFLWFRHLGFTHSNSNRLLA